MPYVHNPSGFNLICTAADGAEILSGGKLKVSEEVAAKVSRVVFRILEDAEVEVEKATARRKTVTRGGTQAEITVPPKSEKR